MSACEQMDARFEKYNTTFHATRAFVRRSTDTSTQLWMVVHPQVSPFLRFWCLRGPNKTSFSDLLSERT